MVLANPSLPARYDSATGRERAKLAKGAPHEEQVARYKAEMSPYVQDAFANAEQCILEMAVAANTRRDVCRP